MAQSGDVLICVVGATAGKLNLGADCAIGRSVAAIRPGPALDQRFLYFQLLPKVLELRAGSVGSAQGVISSKDLAAIEVILPPFKEQRRIVAALEEHLSDLDAALEGLTRARANYRRYRGALLRAAVDGSLLDHDERAQRGPEDWSPAVPRHWHFATVAELADEVEYGTSVKTQESVDGVPVLRMGNIVDGELSWENLKYLPASHGEFPRLLLSPGDVLFNRTNSPELVGKTAVYGDGHPETSFASYLLRVRLKPGLDPRYFSAYVNSTYGRAWVASVVSQQVGQANVNGTKLRALSVPIPPPQEQERIVAELQSRLDAARRVIADVDVQRVRAARLRQAILNRAFEGKLVPQHPSDESASTLLARTRDATVATSAAATRAARPRSTARRERT